MVNLFAGCYRSKISVIPNNWNVQDPGTRVLAKLLSKPWKIYYRFYDPAFKDDKTRWGKLIVIKGMNEFESLKDRQDITRGLIDTEIDLLDRQGYNPLTEQFMAPIPDEQVYEISPKAPVLVALDEGRKRLDVVPDTMTDIRSVIKGVTKAAEQLFDNAAQKRYSDLSISQITTKHVRYILDQCGRNNPRWSNNRFNMYKAYLSMIFNELKEVEAVETNPTKDISSKKKTRRLKVLLTPDEQRKIETLKESQYNFWRYIHIFFRSSSRTTEILSLKKDDKVNLERQEFILLVKKGKSYREDIRPIPDDVLHLWKEVWNEAKPGQFLFSKFLKPGDVKIGKSQPGRYWTRHVMADEEDGGLGIKKGFYDLKHLNLDMIAEQSDISTAKTAAGHTNENTTRIYAVNEKRRQIEMLKKIRVNFGS